MNATIRPFAADDIEDVVQLSLSAWAPVFSSFENVLGPRIYTAIWPEWKAIQRQTVEKICNDHEKMTVYVAELAGRVVGFIAYSLNHTEKSGEIELLAMHPDYQNHGIGTELNTFVLGKMKESGMTLAVVGTGGDPGHAPARRSYEKAGFTGLPLVRYYKDLDTSA